jgi:hypothetical protein
VNWPGSLFVAINAFSQPRRFRRYVCRVSHTARIIEGGLKMVGTDIIIVGYHSVGWPFWKIEAAGR